MRSPSSARWTSCSGRLTDERRRAAPRRLPPQRETASGADRGESCKCRRADVLSAAALSRIDREVAKYPPDQKQSAVMSALAIAQDEKGWLPPEAMDFVANYLDMPPVAVYEGATFYAMYNRRPGGRYKITIS